MNNEEKYSKHSSDLQASNTTRHRDVKNFDRFESFTRKQQNDSINDRFHLLLCFELFLHIDFKKDIAADQLVLLLSLNLIFDCSE